MILTPGAVSAYILLDLAGCVAKFSNAERLKVGAVLVNSDYDEIIGFGYNHMPDIKDSCEYTETNENGESCLISHDEVIHAETEAISDAAKKGHINELIGSSLYLTHSPCIHCAKMIYAVGIKNVYYKNKYRNTSGLDFLKECGVNTYHLD